MNRSLGCCSCCSTARHALSAIYANAAMSLNREHQALHDQLTGLPNRTLAWPAGPPTR